MCEEKGNVTWMLHHQWWINLFFNPLERSVCPVTSIQHAGLWGLRCGVSLPVCSLVQSVPKLHTLFYCIIPGIHSHYHSVEFHCTIPCTHNSTALFHAHTILLNHSMHIKFYRTILCTYNSIAPFHVCTLLLHHSMLKQFFCTFPCT